MLPEKRIRAFITLGNFLSEYLSGSKNSSYSNKYKEFDEVIDQAFIYNGWFTKQNVLKSLSGIIKILNEADVRKISLQIHEPKMPKTVAVIMAGNIPLVGFHDFLCVLLSGNKILIKLSSDDKLLLPFLIKVLCEIETDFKEKIDITEGKLQNFDAVIATGSNNSAIYFKQYFGKYPNIIRKNRTSIAVLSGKETKEELSLLGNDIFDYFGLGCRNVSKLFVPADYKFDTLFESVFSFAYVMDNKKYANNHDYQSAIYLLNQEKFLDNNFLIIKQNEGLHPTVGVLFYEEYTSLNELSEKIMKIEPEIQCVVTNIDLSVNTTPFGAAQCPTIFNFADNLNTLAFLNYFS